MESHSEDTKLRVYLFCHEYMVNPDVAKQKLKEFIDKNPIINEKRYLALTNYIAKFESDIENSKNK